jgi:hypothetical protein
LTAKSAISFFYSKHDGSRMSLMDFLRHRAAKTGLKTLPVHLPSDAAVTAIAYSPVISQNNGHCPPGCWYHPTIEAGQNLQSVKKMIHIGDKGCFSKLPRISTTFSGKRPDAPPNWIAPSRRPGCCSSSI